MQEITESTFRNTINIHGVRILGTFVVRICTVPMQQNVFDCLLTRNRKNCFNILPSLIVPIGILSDMLFLHRNLYN